MGGVMEMQGSVEAFNETLFVESVAADADGVAPEDVEVVSVTDAVAAADGGRRRLLLSSDFIHVDFKIVAKLTYEQTKAVEEKLTEAQSNDGAMPTLR